ncbi:MAG: hypothetical protein KF797_14945, partial [Flavobacteriales bacterium]|nr:hypothetical protein [Flavobacteriales bacterium]
APIISMAIRGNVTAWLDGARLFHWELSALDRPRILPDSTTRLSFPVTLPTDGEAHVLAVRLHTGPWGGPALRGFEMSLHTPKAVIERGWYVTHRTIILGFNLFVLLLALSIWWLGRQERVWPWLAALAAINAIITFSKMVEYTALGMPYEGDIGYLWTAIIPVPLMLSMAILRIVLDRARGRGWRIFLTVAIILCVSYFAMESGFGFDLFYYAEQDEVREAIVLLSLALVMGGCFIWIMVDIVRLGILVLRTRGSMRWIGMGILISGAISPVLYGIGTLVINGSQGVTETAADYARYAAIPLCIIIGLALRSAHQNRMLSRQRDELDREVHERTAELRAERDRSEELLLNILPHEVAEELKRKGAAEARNFDQASVLFSDFKGFTTLSQTLPAAAVLEELNVCFRAFDEIAAKYGVEKIKTIGDAYMAAGGLPDPGHSTPADVVLAALAM